MKGDHLLTTEIMHFQAAKGEFLLDKEVDFSKEEQVAFEVFSDEPSSLVGIRYILKKKLKENIGDITLRLGTTHGTNALLERKGAKVLFVTT